MEKLSTLIPRVSYFYIAISIIIFFIGWCNPLVAILGTIITLIGLFFACKNAPKLWSPKNKKEWFLILALALSAFIWVYLSGIGALVFQNTDHECRNSIFELLVTHSWPVKMLYVHPDFDIAKPIVMTYYIAFWLVPAVIGKLFNSVQIGYYAQVVWASISIFLVFYYILSFVKRKSFLPILIFIFFSGLDIIEIFLVGSPAIKSSTSHLEWAFNYLQFSSFTTQLFWVFNQALPAWLITLALLKENNNKSILFLYSCAFLHSTLPAIGLAPIVAYLMYKNGNSNLNKDCFSFSYLKSTLKSACSFQNIVAGFLIIFISFMYLTNNISGGNINLLNSKLMFTSTNIFLFLLFEVGIYLVLIWKYNKNNPLLYIISGCFVLYPFVKLGYGADFCMRATLAPLMILYLFIITTLENKDFLKNKFVTAVLILTLLIGAVTPMHEINRCLYKTHKGITKIESTISLKNFFAFVEGNKFKKYAKNNL